ncbi:WD_REPEATS_REGION domain-containing protein, partial [Haematococcus lacustris]
VQQRIATAEKYVAARGLISTQPQQALALCSALLESMPSGGEGQDMESGIRVGDVFALMIEYWYEARNALEAYKLIEQMRSRAIILSPYLDQRMVDDVYKTLGVEPVADRVGGTRGAGYSNPQLTNNAAYTAEDGYVDDEEGVIDEVLDDDN